MEERADPDHSFIDWLMSQREWVEKTAGAVVLIVEILALLTEIYHGISKSILTQVLNFLFLLFIFFNLRVYFRKEFDVRVDKDEEIDELVSILRFQPQRGVSLSREQKREEQRKEMVSLARVGNKLISQFKSINYFMLSTAFVYAFLILQSIIVEADKRSTFRVSQPYFQITHFFIDFASYAGAFFLLQSFYVMYLRTIDNEGNSKLFENTGRYIFLGVLFLVFDLIATLAIPNIGVFISEFICGVANAIVLILLVARFENKLLDVPPWMLSILYVYAILQTCLPFVTKGITQEMAPGLQEFLEEFSSIVLSCCLIGKVALSAVLLYIINSKRLFYYFMFLRKIRNEEEENWNAFKDLVVRRRPIEAVTIEYKRQNDSYIASLAHPRANHEGKGTTPQEATQELIRNLPGDFFAAKPEESAPRESPKTCDTWSRGGRE